MTQLYLYILLDPDKPNFSKVGITINIPNRLKAYRTASPNCSFYKTYPINDKIHEKKILSILKDIFTVRSEYIHCNPRIVNNIIESYLNDLSFK
jgi:hypothetical protein